MRIYQRTLDRVERAGHGGAIGNPLPGAVRFQDFITAFEEEHQRHVRRAEQAAPAAHNLAAQDGRSIR